MKEQKQNIKKEHVSIRFVLKELMADANLRETDLCRALHIPSSTLNQIILGKTTPRIDTLITIAKYFNISLDELVGLSSTSNTIRSSQPKTEKTENELKSIKWAPELYLASVNLICKLATEHNIKLNPLDAMQIFREVYFYSIQTKNLEPDKQFALWYIKKYS